MSIGKLSKNAVDFLALICENGWINSSSHDQYQLYYIFHAKHTHAQTIFASRLQSAPIILGISLPSIKVSNGQKEKWWPKTSNSKNCKCSHKISNKNVNWKMLNSFFYKTISITSILSTDLLDHSVVNARHLIARCCDT